MINALSTQLLSLFAGRPSASRARSAEYRGEFTRTGGEGQLDIPMPDPTAEDRARDVWQDHGLKLARQEDWTRLCGLIRTADNERKLTPGGMSVAELLAYGARADVVGAVEHALMVDERDSDLPLNAGIEALETVLSEQPRNPLVAAVVALAHMDIGWAWRGNTAEHALSNAAREAFAAHLDRASDILAPFAEHSATSPLLLSTRCAVMRGRLNDPDPLIRAFEDLIDLNPLDTRQMRAFGTSLLPRWNGAYDQLDLAARRVGAKLSPIWGAGGYTWVMLDAVAADSEACAGLDVEYFLEGLRDILALRPDQFTVNLLAAYAGVAMAGETGRSAADANRARIRSARGWIVCDYMTELHPLIWAHAAHGFDNALRIRSLEGFTRRGVVEARRVLDGIFLPELARGQNVVFTENGPKLGRAPA